MEINSKRNLHYFGRAICYSLTLVNPDINPTMGFREAFDLVLKAEKELRESGTTVLWEGMPNLDDFWASYFEGARKGVTDALKLRGININSDQSLKIKNSKSMKKYTEISRTYYKEKEKLKFADKRDALNVKKAKLYSASYNLTFKMVKIKNSTYMKGLAEDIARKVSKSPEVLSLIANIVGEFKQYIESFAFNFGGTFEIPEGVIGILPNNLEEVEEYLDTNLKKVSDPPPKSENFDEIRKKIFESAALPPTELGTVSNVTNVEEEEEEDNPFESFEKEGDTK